jgi:iron complex outermembrane receptor protein
MGVGYRQQLSSKWSFKSSVFLILKCLHEPRPFDILDDKTNSIGFRSTLNYKDTLWSVPFETSLGRRWFWRLYLSLSKFICFATQSSIAGAQFSKKQQKSSYQNYFLQADFSLSEKLHLETVWLLILHAIRDLLQQRKQFLAYTFEVWSPRQDSIDLLKQDDLCVH